MHNEAMKMAKHAMADACAKGYDCMTSQDWDDLKDCVETAKNAIKCDYYYRLVERMKKDEEEEKREDAYFLDMLKDEYKDDYKRMKDEYGDEEGERRFYDNYRHANGRFARKGTGTYTPRDSGRRRGYIEPKHWPMMPDYDAEWNRDMDRSSGKMYYAPMNGNNGNTGGTSSNSNGGDSGDSSRGYSDGYDEGQKRGYSEGYEQGNRDGKRNGGNSRYDNAKRGYEEAKMSDNNTPDSKKKAMESLDNYMREIADDMTQLVGNMDNSEKTMLKSKLQGLMQKIQ